MKTMTFFNFMVKEETRKLKKDGNSKNKRIFKDLR
jgi:hypothetical protein